MGSLSDLDDQLYEAEVEKATHFFGDDCPGGHMQCIVQDAGEHAGEVKVVAAGVPVCTRHRVRR